MGTDVPWWQEALVRQNVKMALPTGTVTLLFTDIEGSTRLWDQHPQAMSTALEHHDALMRSAIESSGGYVFKTVGDAFCAAFASAKEAVVAAGEAQRALHAEAWPDHASLHVRMALHTGECEERDGDYFGPAVNRVARLEATAHGGQVVVSQATVVLVRDRLPSGLHLVDLGSHYLKDMDRPEEVFQLTVDGIPAAFPPLRSHFEDPAESANPTNLTQPVSSFVGRDAEVAELAKLVGNNRLVTLTGSGGVGKTRLAIEVGRAVLPDSPDGVWISELAAVTDSALVAPEILSDLGIGEQSGYESVATLVEVLSTQSRLVILDNCEQVLDGCAAVADAIVRNCPEIRLLSTSREPLRIEGEVIYRVPSLSLPPEQVDDRTHLAGSGAVDLFIERATAQASGFELTDDDAPLVAAICRRLDGMPLALELATARLRSMSLSKLHDRLEHRFGLLTGGSRVALPRQQTLKALVDWSFDLLSGPEQALFRRTSVFVDGFDLEAAEGVCALDDIPDWDIADLLSSLVDKSLVVAEQRGTEIRYRLQETLRQYGTERLAEAGPGDAKEADQAASAHADYYMAFAELAAPNLEGRSYTQWMGRLDSEDLNLRAAFNYALATPEGADRVLEQFWSMRRYWREARQPAQALAILEQALDRVGPDITPTRLSQALYCKCLLVNHVDRRVALEAISNALPLARRAGNQSLEAEVQSRYSRSLSDNGNDQAALESGAEAVALARQIDDPVLLGMALFQFASVLDQAGDAGAEVVYLEGLALVEHSQDHQTERHLRNNYALVLIDQGNLSDARRHLKEALNLAGHELGARTMTMYNNLGWVLLQEGDAQRSASYHSDVLRSARLTGITWMVPYTVLGLACCATQLDETERAARLHGGADALLLASSNQWESLEGRIRERDITVLREGLGNDFERLYAEGAAMSHDEVIKLALSGN
jgi:predicted ATPase/class 3 adenylate cyclase